MKGRITLSLLAVIATALLAVSGAVASGGSGSGGGGGGGGGGTATTVASPLPATPPAPDVVLRESFGPGIDPDFVRPQGRNGNLRQVSAGTDLSGFWAEYPVSKNEQWTTPAGGWHFAFASLNPFETPASPIQPLPFNRISFSDWASGIASYPDAVLPFRGLTDRYSVSAELYPAPVDGGYAAVGPTTSGTTQANLPASGQISVLLSQVAPFDGANGRYEVPPAGRCSPPAACCSAASHR